MNTMYIVIRVFSKEERPDPTERSVFYGWCGDKHTVKAFMKQRSSDKYDYCKVDKEDPTIVRLFPELEDSNDSNNTMIDYVRLKFASSGEEINFYSTMRELQEAEKKIQQRFHDMASIDNIEALKLFMHLDKYYLDALEFIGFRPSEVDLIYDSSDYRDGYNTLELVDAEIDEAYDGTICGPGESSFYRFMNPPGLSSISTVADKLYYSVENFVTALRDDL